MKRLSRVSLVSLAILLAANVSFAKDEEKSIFERILETAISPAESILGHVSDLGRIVVAPTRVEEKLGTASSSITTVDPAEAERRGESKLEEVLRDMPAVDVAQNGVVGPTSVFMRGANSNQTLVLLDGVKLYDPISTSGAYDFTFFTLDNIERIEVVRGAQSSLYGSDAVGGIISMETKKANTTYASGMFEAGSFFTTHESFEMGSFVNNLHYSVAGSQINSKSISQAQAKKNNVERDPYDRTVFSARVDYDINENMTTGGTFRYTLAHIKYDNFDVDDPALCARNESTIFTYYVDQKIFDWWKYRASMGWMNTLRRDYDDPHGPDTYYLRDYYLGKYFKFDYLNTFSICDIDTVLIGYEHTNELGDSYKESYGSVSDMPKVFSKNEAFYLENRFNYKDRLVSTQSMRVDHHSSAGTHVTYKVDGAYLFATATKVRGSIATGFKAPNLYQLHAPSSPGSGGRYASGGGNSSLEPETSFSYEYGIDQYIAGEKFIASVVYFNNRFKNLINTTTDSQWNTSQYTNIGKAYSYGIESEVKFKPCDYFKAALSYTWMKTKDYSTDEELLKRPENKFKAQFSWTVFPKFEVDTIIRYTGIRFDYGPVKLKQYTVVDLAFNYDLTKNLTLTGRVENLFDKMYEETAGNGEPGIGAYGGVRAKF